MAGINLSGTFDWILCHFVASTQQVMLASSNSDYVNNMAAIRTEDRRIHSTSSSPSFAARRVSAPGRLRLPSDRRVSSLVDELLREIYSGAGSRRPSLTTTTPSPDSDTGTVDWSCDSTSTRQNPEYVASSLAAKNNLQLQTLRANLVQHVQHAGSVLVKQLRRRDIFRLRHQRHCDVITALLQAQSLKRRQDTRLRFSVAPLPGDSGFTQWHDAMKMVARLPGGIPSEFRRRLWLTLAEKHLQARGIDWPQAERAIFNEWSNPDDDELGIQIVKDLHRTGCQLFCGAAGERNQALLKRVLLAYARWNKAVGYCQGFNMLAALILQVMERSEADSVKVMIYLIEGVLPESYFANNLRGLSVDMAVFRELLRMRLPALSKHLETLQSEAGDATGTSYEPPLTNVFTMQWFLTLFANCLPQATVLRVWDLVFLEGNEVLLRTALAIWTSLEDRIMAVDSADEFYSIMGVLTREMLEFGLMDPNNLVKIMVNVAPFPFPELPELRDRYTYNITPWSHSVSNAARRGLRLFQSDDDEPDEEDAGDDEKMAVAAAFGVSAVFRSSPRRRGSMNLAAAPDKERLNLDISALKQQYSKLRERQRQAHIILSAACARQTGPTRQVATASTAPVVMNHLLLGRSALLGVRRGNAGTVPATAALHQPQKAARVPKSTPQVQVKHVESGETLHWRDAKRRPSTTLENIKTPSPEAVLSPPRRSRSSSSSSTTSSASSASSSSGSTELCDEPDKMSDFDGEEVLSSSPRKHKDKKENINKDNFTLPLLQLQTTSNEISPVITPPSETASTPTEEASSQDRISQISLSPIMNSPSMSTIQNSPTSTIQNSPINTGSPTLVIENSISDETIVSINQDYSMSENTLQLSETIHDLPSLANTPTTDHIPITLTSPDKPSIFYSPTECVISDFSDVKSIPNFIDLNASPQKDRLKSPLCKMTSIDQATSPIDWSKIDLTDEIKIKSTNLQKNSPDLITSHWVDPANKLKDSNKDDISSLNGTLNWDITKDVVDYNQAVSKVTDISLKAESSPVEVSWKTPEELQQNLVSWDTANYSTNHEDKNLNLPSWKSPEECSTNPLAWKTPAESPKELPPWNTPEVNELLTWENTPSKDNASTDNKCKESWMSNSTLVEVVEVIESDILEKNITTTEKNTTIMKEEGEKPLISLDDIGDIGDSVFLTEGSNVKDLTASSPMRMVPLGSLSASLSSPSSNEDDTLPDLMVITPPKELSPLSPLKSPWSSEKSPKYTSETISWDKTKFPFPVKSPVLFEKIEETPIEEKSTEEKKISKSPEFKWKYSLPESTSEPTEQNLIKWDHSPKEEKCTDIEPQTSEWKSKLSWSDVSENEWKNDKEEWQTKEDNWKIPSPNDKWEADPKVRDSASDAPASPLPSNERDITENWHKLPPQFPSLTESSVTSTPNLSPVKDSWRQSTQKNTKPSDSSDTDFTEKSPEKTPRIRKKKSIRFDTSPEGKAEGKSDNNDSRRKRWTIAEPIEWSAICDALNQQENATKNQEVEENETEEKEDEESTKEVEERGAFGRRNSERALQIIQENSEILQRIMRESRGKQLMERETKAARPTTIGLGGSRGVRWGSQRALTVAEPESTPPLPESPTNSWKPSTCFPSLGESPQTTSPAPFNPFPVKPKIQPKELGVKLGLYPTRQISK